MNATVPVSVIIPCYNCAATAGRALSSVLAQTRPPAQLILVDDASDDDGATRGELRALRDGYGGSVRIEIIEHSVNLGAAAARNSGWNAATQDYVAFLDADDAWDTRKLEVQHAWMARHPSAAMSGHLSRRLDAPAAAESPAEDFTAQRIGLRRLLLTNVFGTRTVMLRRDLPLRFDPQFRRSDDFLLWLSIIRQGYEAWLLNVALAYTFKDAFGAGGLSQDLWAMEKSELAVYGELARRGDISSFTHWLLAPYSLLKHAKRVAQRAIATSRLPSSPPRS
jgi:glycosyltransferase involved in cell wall biosynthesis